MTRIIGIYTLVPQQATGPIKVAMNLLLGLRKLKYSVAINLPGHMTGCLSSMVPELKNLPSPTLIGPNISNTPSDMPWVWERYKYLVLPSSWSRELFAASPLCAHMDISVWPVGIDTDRFRDTKTDKDQDCFIYLKNRSADELNECTTVLLRRNLSYSILSYGNYSEEELQQQCARSRFCIVLGNTETQGIALMEIMSMNVPCFVIDLPGPSADGSITAPYFSEECGTIDGTLESASFESFLQSLSTFSPRSYVEREHTLELAAKRYVAILERTLEPVTN